MNTFMLALMNLENESDRQFMEELFREYQPLMLRLALKIVRNVDIAEDIVEEVLLSLFSKVENLTQQSSPVLCAYIVTSIKNTSINYLKRKTLEHKHHVHNGEAHLENCMYDSEEIDAKLVLLDTMRELKTALRSLPAEEHRVLQMKFFLELSDAEIAETLGIKKESVGRKVLRAKNRLRGILIKERESNE